MKTKTITLYSRKELKESFPDGFENALSKWQEWQENFCFADSLQELKDLLSMLDYEIKNYTVSAYCLSFIDIEEKYQCDYYSDKENFFEMSIKRLMKYIKTFKSESLNYFFSEFLKDRKFKVLGYKIGNFIEFLKDVFLKDMISDEEYNISEEKFLEENTEDFYFKNGDNER